MQKNTWRWNVLALAAVLLFSGCSHEGTDWKSATAADTTEAYQQFLKDHPKSSNAAQARSRIDQLQDVRDWQVAAAADTRDAYQQYLTQHADGKWAQEAHIRIENFAQSQSGSAGAAGGNANSSATASANNAAAATPAQTSASGAMEYVQLGAFATQARAQSQWQQLRTRYAHELGALTPRFVPGRSKLRHVVRLQVGVSSRAQARSLCAKLKAHSQSCVPVTAVAKRPHLPTILAGQNASIFGR
jgi:hypothetical protein